MKITNEELVAEFHRHELAAAADDEEMRKQLETAFSSPRPAHWKPLFVRAWCDEAGECIGIKNEPATDPEEIAKLEKWYETARAKVYE